MQPAAHIVAFYRNLIAKADQTKAAGLVEWQQVTLAAQNAILSYTWG